MTTRSDSPLALTIDRARSREGAKWSLNSPEVIPTWVADMDFDPPPEVLDRITGIISRGDLGYNNGLAGELGETFGHWQSRHHGWDPDPSLIHPFTSALHAMEVALWQRTSPGDGIVLFTPIYHPFLNSVADSGRRLVDVPLDPDGWRLDPERLESAIDDTTRMVLFCQPHNPTGRVFDAEEIRAFADVVERHDLLVVSDEIWGDLTHEVAHVPLATQDERFAGRLITLGSASKTFNLAGLRTAVAHIDDPELTRILGTMPSHINGAPSTLGAAATLTAWRECDDWAAAVAKEITARRDQLATRLAAEVPDVGFQIPEATYLAWLDFRETSLCDDPADVLLDTSDVALSPGLKYGVQGAGFARVNFATTETILDEIINRIVSGVHNHGSNQ